MFHVFGVHPEKERARLIERTHQQKDETDEEFAERIGEAVKAIKPKRVTEYPTLALAESYATALRKHGWEQLTIKRKVWTRPRRFDEQPGTAFISLAEAERLDLDEQLTLKAMHDGGRITNEQTMQQLRTLSPD